MRQPVVLRSELARSLRRSLLFLAVAVLGGSGLLLVLLITERGNPPWAYLLYSVASWIWLLAGVLAWWRRPSNAMGALLVLGGLAMTLGEAVSSSIPIVASVGAVFATAPLAVTVHLLHAFPSGRIRGRASRITVVAAYVVVLVVQFPLYAFDAAAVGLPVFVADRPDLLTAGRLVQQIAGAAVMIATAVILAGRLRRARPYQRRVLIPLFGYGTFAVLFIPVSSSVLRPWLDLDPVLLAASQIVVVAAIPIAFALAVLRGGFARTGELAELATWLGAPGDRSDLSAALASVLGDASLELVFWMPQQRSYVDGTGRPAALPEPGAPRSWVPIGLAGQPVGAIIYDADLIADPELVSAAGRVVAVGVDRERLTAALRTSEQSLRRSRERLVETADRERKRIAQDLHDGIQVQLVLLAMQAQQLAIGLDPADPIRGQAVTLRRGIDAAAAELRALVHAVMPASLVERGLASATEDLVDRVPLRTGLHITGVGSLPDPVQSTAYFVVAEAVTNVVKHADAGRVTVRLTGTDGMLDIEVADDGRGGASVEKGTGIRGLVDRVDALGGTFELTSPPGGGTTLRVRLPTSP
jgi:signal transduction histidine kinase